MPALLLTNPRAGPGGPRLKFNGATVALGEQELPDPTEYDLLIVEGGDGTLQRVMTELLAKTPAAALPKVAVLPGGSTNMSAADINEHRGFRQCAVRLQSILQGAPQPFAQCRPLVSVQPSPPTPTTSDGAESLQPADCAATAAAIGPAQRQESSNDLQANPPSNRTSPPASGGCRRYGWFFGIGAVCSGIQRWSEKRPGSRLQASTNTAWSLFREFQGPRRHQQIHLDGRARSVFAMMATTLDRLLFGSRPYWHPQPPTRCEAAKPPAASLSNGRAENQPNSNDEPAAQRDRAMHSTWVFADARGLLRRSFRLLRGDPTLGQLPGYQSGDIADLQIDFDGPYALDGELFDNRGALRLSLSGPIRWLPL